ncbi:YdeI/OmpD-associated family protein [Brevibacterium album]|uniref:YdeI/OmpD-associated family protein n=1 Tax=Brevibacterium album TaxID=417948 RepID=UPI0004145106|nr:YdeI/OmpD-associated family protein [Brevibacterium album]
MAGVHTSGGEAAASGRARVSRIGGRLLVRLPAEASLAMPSRGQVAVHARLGEYAFDTVLEPDGRKGHWIAVTEELRAATGVRAGEETSFEIERSDAWPEPEVPADLREALAAEPETAAPWQDITPMARWEWVRWIGATKSAATRDKRIGVTVSKLLAGKRRPCCFDLASCTDPELAKSGKLIEES